MDTQKNDIIAALRRFIAQRPGLEPANYIGDWRDVEGRRMYRAESRQITRDRHDAEALLRYVELSGVDSMMLSSCLPSSGRLTWNGARLDYCTGQYFPTEYRVAAARALASALWHYWWETSVGADKAGAADKIHKIAHNALGRRLAKRFFQ